MNDPTENPKQTIAMRRIDRALHELRGGYPLLLSQSDKVAWLVVSAETMEQSHLPELAALGGQDASLAITGVRAARLGLVDKPQAPAYVLPFAQVAQDETLLAQLIDPVQGKADAAHLQPQLAPANDAQHAALLLAKLAALLPAVIVAKITVDDAATWAVQNHILTVELSDIADYKNGLCDTLTQVTAAHVPLKLAEDARVLAFRPRYGAVEHLAICIGAPESQDAPLVRVHSSCVTGDVLGSMRCDCGEQLQEAIARVAKEGHGIVLYMNQEGRGIGIVNKLRAYQLQDAGLDTLDANEEMGFAADERQFDAAAHILSLLGVTQVRLLSNNPDKVAQLEQCGVAVRERVSLALPRNAHNRDYLETKETRCGHIF